MTYSLAQVQGQQPVGSEDRVETNRRTDGGDCITVATAILMWLVKMCGHLNTQIVASHHPLYLLMLGSFLALGLLWTTDIDVDGLGRFLFRARTNRHKITDASQSPTHATAIE